MTILLPYVFPLILGRTFDMNKMIVGVDVFDKETIDHRTIFHIPTTSTFYGIVENSGEVRDAVSMKGAISLKVKSGLLKGSISGEYLSDNIDRRNTLEVVSRRLHYSSIEELPDRAKPIDDWQKYGEALGTHYVSAIHYGSEMITSVRFKANSMDEKQKIKEAIGIGGMFRIFGSGLQVEGERMREVSKFIENSEIKVFSPVPISAPPTHMDDLEKISNELPNELELINEGRGIPIRVLLRPLTDLDPNITEYKKDSELDLNLEYFEDKLVDLLRTKKAISNWMNALKNPLTERQEQKIGEFYGKTENTLKIFHEVIGTLDTTQGTEQLKKAEDAYGYRFSGIFYRDYLKLRRKIGKEHGEGRIGASHTLPYVLPMMLGRTFDLNKMKVGVDIFDMTSKRLINRIKNIENPVTETHYKIVENAIEARDLLDIDGALSLNVKSGLVKGGISGEYLSDHYNRENTVEVVVKATYQTFTEMLHVTSKPILDWQKYGEALGTHFVRSITYGGELIASIRLEANNTRDKLKIKGAIDVGGRFDDILDLGVQVEGEYMRDIAKSIESTQIKVFSSIPLSSSVNDMESLKKILKEFPNDLNQFNEGWGIPLKMELWPLEMLDSTRVDKLQNRLLDAYLDTFEQKFDDLLNTKTAIFNWMKAMQKPLTEEQEKEVGDFCNEVENTLKVFYKTIGSLDMSQGSHQLEKAFEAYGFKLPGFFYKRYSLLRQKIAEDQGEWYYSRGNGITYVHWGKSKCSEEAEQLSNGYAFGPQGFGSGANYLCLPNSPDLGLTLTNQKDAPAMEGASFSFPGEPTSQLSCSVCRLGARGSVLVFSGKTTCPDEWDYIYDGLLMSGSNDATSTNFLCLDRNAEKKNIDSTNPLIPNWGYVLGERNENDEQMRKLFSCVVCAK